MGPPESLWETAVVNSVMCDPSRRDLFQNGHRTRLPLTAVLNIATIRYPFDLPLTSFASSGGISHSQIPYQDARNS
jgi:hypothetical protein